MSEVKTDVSIIIVNYKVAPLIVACVRSIIEKTKGVSYEIIVVDNDSQDDSVSVLENNLGNDIKLIKSGSNLGFGKANNLGAKHANGEYLFLLNPDTVLINDAVSILHSYIKSHEDIGVVGGNLYDETGKQAMPSYSMEFSSVAEEKRNSSYYGMMKNKISRKRSSGIRNDFNCSNQPVSVGYIFGADMMLSKGLFEQVKGFDEDFFMYGEEAELQWRIKQLGYKIVNCPDARIIHLEGRSTKTSSSINETQFRMRMTGMILFFKKAYGEDTAKKFYKYRRKRYERQRMAAILKINRNLAVSLRRMIVILDEVYTEVFKKYNCV